MLIVSVSSSSTGHAQSSRLSFESTGAVHRYSLCRYMRTIRRPRTAAGLGGARPRARRPRRPQQDMRNRAGFRFEAQARTPVQFGVATCVPSAVPRTAAGLGGARPRARRPCHPNLRSHRLLHFSLVSTGISGKTRTVLMGNARALRCRHRCGVWPGSRSSCGGPLSCVRPRVNVEYAAVEFYVERPGRFCRALTSVPVRLPCDTLTPAASVMLGGRVQDQNSTHFSRSAAIRLP